MTNGIVAYGSRALVLAVLWGVVVLPTASGHADWRTPLQPVLRGSEYTRSVDGIFVAPDGSPVVTGSAACGPFTPRDELDDQLAWLSAGDGHVQWSLDGQGASPDNVAECGGSQLLFDSDSNVYVVGYPIGQPPSGNAGWYLASYTSSGLLRWTSPLDGETDDSDVPNIVIGADGNVYAFASDHLHAYRASDGASLWDVGVPLPPYGFANGLYADDTGLTVGGTMRFDYNGTLTHPAPSAGTANSSAQEPGGAVYTVDVDHSHCYGSNPVDILRVTRWTLSGIGWTKSVRISSPAECAANISETLPPAAAVGGGVIVGAYNSGSVSRHELFIYKFDTAGHLKWTHVVDRGWEDDFVDDLRVATNGEVVTLDSGTEPCSANEYHQCRAADIDFLNGVTGRPSRIPIVLHNTDLSTVQAAFSEPSAPPYHSLTIGSDTVYVAASIDGSDQAIAMSEPGLGSDYAELVRADYNGPLPHPTFVALGDSYSSGEGNEPYEVGTDIPKVDMCHRSSASYPMQVAHDLAFGSMIFAACSGAVTADIFSPNTVNTTEPSQISRLALSAHTTLVTITIGGDDVGFRHVLEECVTAALHERFGCSKKRQLRAEIQSRLSALAGRGGSQPGGQHIYSIAQILEAIHAEAPNAQIIIGGYPPLFGTSDTYYALDPTAPSGRSCEVGTFLVFGLWIDYADAQWLNNEGEKLNRAIEGAALKVGRKHVAVRYAEPVQFEQHRFCDSSTLWFHRLELEPTFDPSSATAALDPMPSSFHPTAEGQALGYTPAIERAIK